MHSTAGKAAAGLALLALVSPGQLASGSAAAAERARLPAGRLVVEDPPPGESAGVELGPEDIVIEAERFAFMTYGWEIGEDPRASGGRYIHMKEGVGDFESEGKIAADPTVRSGDFYNVSGDRRRLEARRAFTAPRGGRYFLAARTMAHASRCSNITFVTVNGVRREAGRNGSKPFVWLWHEVAEVYLRKGPNTLSFMAHQDDVKVDQVILTRVRLPSLRLENRTFSGGCAERPSLPDGTPPANISLSVETLAITDGRDPAPPGRSPALPWRSPGMSVYVHRIVPHDVEARLTFALELPGQESLEDSRTVRLTDSSDLVEVRWLTDLPVALPGREYLVRCRLSVEGREIEERTLVLFRGYDWSVLGPLPHMEVTDEGRPEKDLRPEKQYRFGDRWFGWRAYREDCTDHFGIMDFGRFFRDETLPATRRAALYAYTEVRARKAGRYLLKAQGDDNLVVWINGRKAVTISEHGPPIRTAREKVIRLYAGRNRILFRLNQVDGQWQAAIRIRTLDDHPADVEGVPFADQDADLD